MNPAADPDNRRPRHQIRSGQMLMMRVALALLDDARRRRAFERDPRALAARTAELEAELAEGESDRNADSEPRVLASPLTAEEISLSAPGNDGSAVRFKSLRLDGVLHGGGVAFGVSLDAPGGANPSPPGPKRSAQPKPDLDPPRSFRGDRFLGTIAATLQPGSEVQILAAELFGDGLIVHASFDGGADAALSLTDDLGTEYHCLARSRSGVQVMHECVAFAPAAPVSARVLRIISSSGTVELALQPR